MQTSQLQKLIGTGMISVRAFWKKIKRLQKGDELTVVMIDNALIVLKHDGLEKEHLQKLGIKLEDD